MTTRNLTGKAKCGLLRKGNRVYITLQFENEYDAMQMFDVWSMEEIEFSFNGPKELVEKEDGVDG